MAQDFTMCVGTIGTGIWRSADGGGTWGPVREGIWSESRVYSLTGHPHNPHVLFAGTDDGIYRSQDGGKHFEHLDSPMNTRHVWKIAIDPVDPNTVYWYRVSAGTLNVREGPGEEGATAAPRTGRRCHRRGRMLRSRPTPARRHATPARPRRRGR